MKTLLFLPTLTLFLTFNSSAQILEIGNKWIFDYRDYRIQNGDYFEEFEMIEVVSDSLINGQLYFMLVTSRTVPCQYFNEIEFLREEDDKIYRLDRDRMGEKLMIDFTVQSSYNMIYDAGGWRDSTQTIVINDSIGIETLPSGDQIEVVYQRIINNQSYGDDAVYKLSKDIGYIEYSGLLFPDIGTGLCDVLLGANLRCKISATDTIHLTDLDCYESSKKSSTREFQVDEQLVYPNPTSGLLHLRDIFDQVKVFDIFGSMMNLEAKSNELDLSSLQPGIYFLSLKKKGGERIFRAKVVKI